MCYNTNMEQELRTDESVWDLFRTIVRLEDLDECAYFFRDLCTVTELKAMAERWEVAGLLEHDIPYRRISQLTGASTATITRIAHWVKYGEGGYRIMLERVAQEGKPVPRVGTLVQHSKRARK